MCSAPQIQMDTKCQYWSAPEEEPECEHKVEDSEVPLCSVGAAEEEDPFGMPFGGGGGFGESSAFSDDGGVDTTITAEEDAALGDNDSL